MVKAARPGTGQGKGGGRPRRVGEVVQVRLSLPGATYRTLEGWASRDHATMWEIVARLVEGGDLAGPGPEAAPVPEAGGLTPDLVEAEANRLTRADLGLCFVPDLVVALLQQATLPQVHAALQEAVRIHRIELRPESGVNRLSSVEMDLCPWGLQGTRLSWARCR